jgi:hypothetical protein
MGNGIIILIAFSGIWNTFSSTSTNSSEWYYPRIHYNYATSKLYGNYPPLMSPCALVKGDTTYIVWENDLLDIEVIYYDDITDSWSNSVVAGDNPQTNDDHGCPAILRDASGYLYIFYGCHNSPLMMNKSINPDDIISWGSQDTVITPCTYPKPFQISDGTIYIFYRGSGASGDGELTYVKSIDNGETWGSVTTLIEMDSAGNNFDSGYGTMCLNSDSTKIHYAWTTHKQNYYRRNIYYAYYDLSSGIWYDVNDNNLGILIDRTEADASCLITPYGIDSMQLPQMHLYNDNPYITFLHKGTKWQQEFMYHTGSNWSSIDTLCTVDGCYTFNEFIIYEADSVQAFLPMDSLSILDSERGGDIVVFSWNGSTWDTTQMIMSRKQFCSMGIPAVPQGYRGGDIKLIFMEVPYGCTQACSYRIFAWGPNGIVKRTWK